MLGHAACRNSAGCMPDKQASCGCQVLGAKQRYEVGLEKLAFTESSVATMQQELIALQPQLEASTVETETAMTVGASLLLLWEGLCQQWPAPALFILSPCSTPLSEVIKSTLPLLWMTLRLRDADSNLVSCLQVIAQESEEADKVKVVVSREEAIASAEAAKVKAIKVGGAGTGGRVVPGRAASVQDDCHLLLPHA